MTQPESDMTKVPPWPRDRETKELLERAMADRDALIAEMREVLVKVEYEGPFDATRCPRCYFPEGHNHHPNCDLRDLLDRTEGYGGEDSE